MVCSSYKLVYNHFNKVWIYLNPKVLRLGLYHYDITRVHPYDSCHIFSGKSSYEKLTLWLFNIAIENGPFVDGLPMFTY